MAHESVRTGRLDIGGTPSTNTRGEHLWTMVDLRAEIDRFAAMLRASGKRHATIASYVTQSERFVNWLEGTYQPRARRLNNPYGYKVSDETVSKYDPLRDHLKARPGNAVTMTFRQIEHVLGRRLPASARRYAHWWANDRTGNHVQANAWLAAGRKVVRLDLVECRVVFVKRGPQLHAERSGEVRLSEHHPGDPVGHERWLVNAFDLNGERVGHVDRVALEFDVLGY